MAQAKTSSGKEVQTQQPRTFGILTAFKEACFKIVVSHNIDLAEAGDPYFAPREFTRNNQGLVMILENKSSGEHLAVANAQLYHGSERDYIREAQALYFLQQASHMIYEFNRARVP